MNKNPKRVHEARILDRIARTAPRSTVYAQDYLRAHRYDLASVARAWGWRTPAQVSRVVGARRRLAAAPADPLADRRPGWVRDLAIDRAHKRVVRAVREAYAECAFRGAHSAWIEGADHTVDVRVGKPSAKSETSTVWHRKYAWRGTASTHTITVRADWRTTVEARGIAALNGMLTLDAEWVDEHTASVMWVRQGRGTSLVVERGHIARANEGAPWAHGRTAASARRTSAIAQKAHETAVERAIDTSARVTFAQARAAGNCTAGIRAFVARYMPDYIAADSAPVSAVLDAIRACPDVDTRARAWRAIRRAS